MCNKIFNNENSENDPPGAIVSDITMLQKLRQQQSEAS